MEATVDNSYSNHPVLNEIFDEEPTNPMIDVQNQLNSASSVVDEFLAAAYLHGYGGDDPHWTESILEDIHHIRDEDIMSILEENA
jgi:hypothetical protein